MNESLAYGDEISTFSFFNSSSISRLAIVGGIGSIVLSHKRANAQAGAVDIRAETGTLSSPDNESPILYGDRAWLGPNNLIMNATARCAVEIQLNVTGAPPLPYKFKQEISTKAFFVYTDDTYDPIIEDTHDWGPDDPADAMQDVTPSALGNIYMLDNPGQADLMHSGATSPFATWTIGEKGVFNFNFRTWVIRADTGGSVIPKIDWHMKCVFTATEEGWDPSIIPPVVGLDHENTP